MRKAAPAWHAYAAERGAGASEESIHRSVVEHLQRRARSDVFWTHVPNGEARGPGIGGKLKGMGTKAGVPDLLLVIKGRACFLELKREGGRMSPSQADCHNQLATAGAIVETVYGVDQAVEQLKAWGAIR